jgi:hypothetical protein
VDQAGLQRVSPENIWLTYGFIEQLTDAPKTSKRHAGLFGDVSECAIAIVAVKRVANENAAVVQIAAIYK